MINNLFICILLLNVIKANSEMYLDLPNLTVFNITNETAEISWATMNFDNVYFVIKIQNTNDIKPIEHIIESKKNYYKFTNLIPGGNYKIDICIAEKKINEICYHSPRYFCTIPNTPSGFQNISSSARTITVSWFPSSGLLEYYKVEIGDNDNKYMEKTNRPTMTFINLVPGRAYNITVYSDSGYRLSDPITIEYRTKPLPPSNVGVDQSSITPTSFRIVWSRPAETSDFNNYQIILNRQSSQDNFEQIIIVNKDVDSWEFKNLEPSKFGYQVTLKTVSGDVSSKPVYCSTVPLIN